MGNYNDDNRLFVAVRELDAGTAKDFTADDYDVRARGIALGDLAIEMDDENSKFATGDHTQDEAIPGITSASITANVKIAPGELRAGGVSVLPLTKLLESCGLKHTYVGDGSTAGKHVFTPTREADSQTITCGIVDIETGSSPKPIEYKLAGAMGTLSIGAEATGKPFMANMKFEGKIASVTELTSAPVYNDEAGLSTLADKLLNTVIKITALDASGATTGSAIEFCANSANLDLGSEIGKIMCQSDASGVLYNPITKRKPMFKINPMLKRLSDFNFYEAIRNVTLYKVELINDTIEIEIPRAQLMTNSIADNSGFFRNELNFRPLRNVNGSDKEATYSVTINEVEIS